MNDEKQYVSNINGYYVKDEEARETLTDKADIGTTLANYGITDAYTKDEVDTLLSDKANIGTTLSQYGITDAYTKDEVYPKTDYAILTGTVSSTEATLLGKQLDYPTGFTISNTLVLGQLIKYSGTSVWSNAPYSQIQGGTQASNLVVQLSDTKITLNNQYAYTSDLGYDYRIILMKINGGE